MIEVIEKYAAMPFSYGRDCCTFAGECLEAQTGKNPMRQLNYATEAEAQAIITGYGSLEAALRHYLGDPYDGHQDGDICLLEAGDGRQAAGVIWRGQVLARVKGGLMNYPLERALLVWGT